MKKLKLHEYAGLVLEALPCGIPLALDHITSMKVRSDIENIEKNPEQTKTMAITIDQQLRLDAQYKSFHLFDGVLTRRAKAEAYEFLDKLRKEKENEYHKRLSENSKSMFGENVVSYPYKF